VAAKKEQMKGFAGSVRVAAKQVVADCFSLNEFVELRSTAHDSDRFDVSLPSSYSLAKLCSALKPVNRPASLQEEDEEDEGEVEARVLQLAKNLAISAAALEQAITSYLSSHPHSFGAAKEKKFVELLKQAKDSVLSLIKAAKLVVSNPRDWMTRQKASIRLAAFLSSLLACSCCVDTGGKLPSRRGSVYQGACGARQSVRPTSAVYLLSAPSRFASILLTPCCAAARQCRRVSRRRKLVSP